MKLYLSELKKLCASRLLVGLFVGLLALNALLAATVARPTPAERAAREAYRQYLADPAATDAYFADLSRLAAEQFRDETLTLPHTYTEDADDLLVLTLMYERAGYLAGHERQMARHIRTAESRVADLAYYGYTEISYEIRHQHRIIAHYAALCGVVSPTDTYAYGYDDHLTYPMTVIFAGLFVTVAVTCVYRHDRACGFASILRTTSGGRGGTALAKLGATATVAIMATVLLSLSAFAAIGVTVGYSSPAAAVQTLPLCATVPYALTVGEYLALRLALCTLAMLTYAGLVAAVASLQVSYVGCLGVGALFWVGNYALFSHNYLGTPPAARYLNFVSLAEGNTLTDFYRSVSVLGYPVSHPTVLCAAAILLTIVLFAFATLFFVKDLRGLPVPRRGSRLRRPTRKTATVQRPTHTRRVSLSLVGYELKKLRFGWGVLAALLLLGAKGIYTHSTAGNMERYDEALYYEYIITLQPMDSPVRADFMIAERARIDAVMADYPAKTAAYERGELPHGDYAVFLDTYYAARARDGVLRRVERYVASIEAHDRLTGEQGDILYTTGLEVFLGFSSDLFYYFALLFLSVGVFAVEYRGTSSVGASAPLVRATPRGRGPTFAAKLGICTVAGALLALIFRAVGLFVVAQAYILPSMDAAVSSVPGFGAVLSDMTVGQYLLVDFAAQALAGTLLGALIAALSCLGRRPLPILAAALLLTAVPELLTDALFPRTHGMSLLSLTAPQKLFLQSADLRLLSLAGTWMVLVCLAHTVFVTTLVFLAHRIYAGRPARLGKEPHHDPVV